MIFFTEDAVKRRFKDDTDDRVYKLYKMENYDIVNNDTSFTITLMEDIEDEDNAEFMTVTFYPMIESVQEALEAHDLKEVKKEVN